MSDYLKIAAPKSVEIAPFRFEINGKRFELPALTESTAPLELMPLLLLAVMDGVNTDQKIQAGIAFFEYLKNDHPALWRHLKKQNNSLEWINGLMEAWIEHGGIDPKA